MKIANKKSPRKGRIWRLVRNLILIFFLGSVSWVLIAGFVPVWFTPLMIIRTVEAVFDGETPRNSKKWVPIEEISPNMVQAVVASEDNLFLEHNGFSFGDIQKAIKHNKNGKRIRGGSTISQQTAKNVFLWPKRSYVRKGLEAYFTVLIELFWSKERIMEVYLNVIGTGVGIYGVVKGGLRRNPSTYIVRRKNKIVSLMGKLEKVDFDKKQDK